MAIFYTDSGSFSQLEVSGSNSKLSVKSSGAGIFTISGSNGPIFEVGDITPSTNDIYVVSSGSVDVFKIDRNKNVSISGSLRITGSLFVNGVEGGGGGGASFPFTGSAIISGSLLVTGSFSTDRDATINNLTIGRGGGNITTNTAIGSNSLLNNTSGDCNTAVGYTALRNNTSGYSNTAVGRISLCSNIDGYGNTAVGHSTLSDNTTGNFNTAVGDYALGSNTHGSYNTAIGGNALVLNTDASRNVSMGWRSMESTTIGNKNTAIGTYSMGDNRNGNNNTAIGYLSLVANISGDSNTAVGSYSLLSNTSGICNTAIGRNSGCSITIGRCNVVVGSYAVPNRATQNNNLFLSDGGGNLRMWITGSNGAAFFNSSVSASAFIGDGSQLTGVGGGGGNISSNVRGITIYDPTNVEDVTMYYTSGSLVINEVLGVLRGSASPSVTVTLRHSSDRNATGTVIVNAQAVTSTTTAQSLTISGGSVTVPDNNFIWLETTARAGTVTELFIQF